MDDRLKPCPFCGCEAYINEIPPHKHFIVNLPDFLGYTFIECTGCSCAIGVETTEKAIEVWNRRCCCETNSF